MNANAWFSPGRFAWILALLIFSAFPEVILGWKTFIYRDFGFYSYPLAFYYRECFWQGEWPLWNPLNNCGVPFLAQWNTMTLYPGSLFFLLFPLSWSLAVFCIGHQFLAGLGMYYLANNWVKDRWAAAVAGVAYAFNGLVLNSLMWPAFSAAFGWLPWLVFWGGKAGPAGGRAFLTASIVAALLVLSGAPEIILFAGVVLLVQGIDQVRSGGVGGRQLFHRTALFLLLVSGLTAAQVLPFLDLVAHSQRSGSFANTIWAMPGWGWANFLVPLFGCVKSEQGVFMQATQGWTSSYYLGIGVLALALCAIIKTPDRRVRLLAMLVMGSLILALGDNSPFYGWMCGLLPPLRLIQYPVKYVGLAAFAMPLLAGFAVRDIAILSAKTDASIRPRLATMGAVLLGLMLFILWFAYTLPLPPDQWVTTRDNALSRAMWLGLILGLIAVQGRITRVRIRGLLRLLLLLCLWLDVLTHASPQNPTVDRSAYAPGLPYLNPKPAWGESRAMISPRAKETLLRQRLSDTFTNLLCNRMALNCDLNLLDGIPKVDGFYPLYLREASQVHALLYGSKNGLTNLMDYLGVSQLTSSANDLEWSQRTNYLPLVSAGQRPVFADDAATLGALASPGFAPRQVVYLPLDARGKVTASNAVAAHIESARLASHHLEFDVLSAQPSLVSMAQSFYHPWHAYVDGQRVPLWRANYAFQALEVPAGQHHVNVKYEDRAFQVGAVISAVTWIAVLLAWVRGGRLPRTSVPTLAFNEATTFTPKATGSSAPFAPQ